MQQYLQQIHGIFLIDLISTSIGGVAGQGMQQNVFNALLSNGFLRHFLDFFSHGTL